MQTKEKVVFIGGARGLGQAVFEHWQCRRPNDTCYVTSRRETPLNTVETLRCDFSVEKDVDHLINQLDLWKPERVFCFPGGGPYGAYTQKDWKDHYWALQVTLLSPARIAHHFLSSEYTKQIVLIGSAIAESQPDPFAASYSAAKHGLYGLVSSLQQEDLGKDLRLASPGYMATDLLPQKSADKKNLKTRSVVEVAKEIVDWSLRDGPWHLRC